MRRDWPAMLLCLPFLGPIAFLLLASFTPSREFGQGRYWSFPPTLESFEQAWQSATFVLYYRNTILYTVGLLAVQLVTVTLAGYALARLRFPGRQAVFYLVQYHDAFGPTGYGSEPVPWPRVPTACSGGCP